MADPGELQVRGGAGGVSARLEDLDRAGDLLRSLAGQLGEQARAVLAVSVAPGGPTGALQCPATFARAEAALAGAVVGPAGLLTVATRVEVLGSGVLAAAAAYRGTDAAAATALRSSTVLAGRAAGTAVAAFLGPELLAGAAALVVVVITRDRSGPTGPARPLPEPMRRIGGLMLRLLADQAGTVQAVIPVLPGAVGGFTAALPGGRVIATRVFGRPGGPATPADLAAGLGVAGGLVEVAGGPAWFQERMDVRVRVTPASARAPAAGAGDLLGRVPQATAERAKIHVERVGTGTDRRWLVAVPGTSDWSPVAGRTPLDLTGDVRLMAGERSAGMAGVVAAMRATGVRPGEPVLLVGHSQGGLIAAAVAADPAVRREFTVSHVLTSGAPVASIPVPDDVQVLSVEHSDDLVPALDGAANHDRPNWITVTAAAPTADLPAVERDEPLLAHRGELYRRTAERIDASTDPTLQAWRDGMSPFLAGTGSAWDVEISRVGTP